MALDPALDPAGTWTRPERLAIPAVFVRGELDALTLVAGEVVHLTAFPA